MKQETAPTQVGSNLVEQALRDGIDFGISCGGIVTNTKENTFVEKWMKKHSPEPDNTQVGKLLEGKVKLFVTDHADPSVGIMPETWEVEAPFSREHYDEPEDLDLFRKQAIDLFKEFAEGKLTATYDFEFAEQEAAMQETEPPPTQVGNEVLHSKGEWVVEHRNGKIFIEAIGEADGEPYAVEVCQLHGTETIDEKDAAFICKAVNNYSKLVEENKKLVESNRELAASGSNMIEWLDEKAFTQTHEEDELVYNDLKTALTNANKHLII